MGKGLRGSPNGTPCSRLKFAKWGLFLWVGVPLQGGGAHPQEEEVDPHRLKAESCRLEALEADSR